MQQLDFLTSMGESFSECVCPPVPFEDASPHECCEVICGVLGEAVSPERLAALDKTKLVLLAKAFGKYFESPAPTTQQIQKAIAATIYRCPVKSKEKDA